MMKKIRILIVEDEPGKLSDLRRVTKGYFGARLELHEANTLLSGQSLIETQKWDLLVLDVSLDIVDSENTYLDASKHDLGGLIITKRMSLLKLTVPTVVVTGLDYFRRGDLKRFQDQTYTREQFETDARKHLKENLLGVIKYGPSKWKQELIDVFEREFGE